MGCSCGKNKAKYEVVVGEGDTARVLYTSTSKVAADSMAARHEGARVRPQPAPVPRPAARTAR